MYKASKRSKENLKGVDERLVLLVGYALAISKVDFVVVEGLSCSRRIEKDRKTETIIQRKEK